MRCAPRQVPERAGRGYQRAGASRPALSTGGPGPHSSAAAAPGRDDGRGAGAGYCELREAWCVRTSAAVTAASATTAARAAAGRAAPVADDEAASCALSVVQAGPVEAGELTEHRHRGAVVAAGHATGAVRAAAAVGAVGATEAAARHEVARRVERGGGRDVARRQPGRTDAGVVRVARPGRPCGAGPPVGVWPGGVRGRPSGARPAVGAVPPGSGSGRTVHLRQLRQVHARQGRHGRRDRLDDVGDGRRQRRQLARDRVDDLVRHGGGQTRLGDDPVGVGDRAGGRRVVERPRRGLAGLQAPVLAEEGDRDVGVDRGGDGCRPAAEVDAALVLRRDLVDEGDRATLVHARDRRRDVPDLHRRRGRRGRARGHEDREGGDPQPAEDRGGDTPPRTSTDTTGCHLLIYLHVDVRPFPYWGVTPVTLHQR